MDLSTTKQVYLCVNKQICTYVHAFFQHTSYLMDIQAINQFAQMFMHFFQQYRMDHNIFRKMIFTNIFKYFFNATYNIQLKSQRQREKQKERDGERERLCQSDCPATHGKRRNCREKCSAEYQKASH